MESGALFGSGYRAGSRREKARESPSCPGNTLIGGVSDGLGDEPASFGEEAVGGAEALADMEGGV